MSSLDGNTRSLFPDQPDRVVWVGRAEYHACSAARAFCRVDTWWPASFGAGYSGGQFVASFATGLAIVAVAAQAGGYQDFGQRNFFERIVVVQRKCARGAGIYTGKISAEAAVCLACAQGWGAFVEFVCFEDRLQGKERAGFDAGSAASALFEEFLLRQGARWSDQLWKTLGKICQFIRKC